MSSPKDHSGLSLEEAASEARRIIEHAQSNGVLLRLLGALAITMRSLESGKNCFLFLEGRIAHQEKPFTDIDLVGYTKQTKNIIKVLEELGYQNRGGFTDIEFNRLVYVNQTKGLLLDVFLDTLNMCHKIDFRERLETQETTAPPADLLLTKMQIVRITEKDIKDAVCLLLDHPVGSDDQNSINCRHIAEILAKDWGFYYTVTTNLSKLKTEFTNSYKGKLSESQMQDLNSKIGNLLDAIEREPKTTGWKMRSKVGPRKKWYQDVEAY